MATVRNAFGISDQLGDGGAGLSPGDGSGPSDISKFGNLITILRSLRAANWPQLANLAAFQATIAANRADGQMALKLDDYTQWVWKAADATAADANHIVPTDVGAGAGRWVNIDGTGGGGGAVSGGTQVGTTAALVAGVSATINATVTASSKIYLSRATVGASTALGELVPTNIVAGANGTGSFKVTSATLGTPGTPLAGDLSTVNWMIIG